MRMVKGKLQKEIAICVASIAVSVTPALADVVHCDWIGCDSGLTCLFEFCWCEGDWDDAANWSCTGWPDSASKRVFIEHSNESKTCNLADDEEGWLQINLVTTVTRYFDIQAECGGIGLPQGFGCFNPGKLRLLFWGNATLTVGIPLWETGHFYIDGIHGAVVFEVGGGAKVETV